MATEEEKFRARAEEEKFRARAEMEAQQAPSRRTPAQMMAHKLGVGARGLIEGTTGLATTFTDIPVVTARALGKKTGPTAQEWVSNTLTKLGLPKAETGGERLLQGAYELAPSAALGAKSLAQYGATKLTDVGRGLMTSALKPTETARKTGDAAVAIETMLQKGMSVNEKSVRALSNEIDLLNGQVQAAIANSTGKVNKADAARGLSALIQKFKAQVNPNADLEAIRKAWTEFKSHPFWKGGMEMSVQDAQAMKQGTYKQLRGAYGQLSGAAIEAQKTLASGLKSGIEKAVPGVAELNREESRLIKTLNVTERAVFNELKRNPGGLAWLTHDIKNWTAFMADKSANFKSLVARMLYSGSQPISAIGGGAAGATAYGTARLLENRERPSNRP